MWLSFDHVKQSVAEHIMTGRLFVNQSETDDIDSFATVFTSIAAVSLKIAIGAPFLAASNVGFHVSQGGQPHTSTFVSP